MKKYKDKKHNESNKKTRERTSVTYHYRTFGPPFFLRWAKIDGGVGKNDRRGAAGSKSPIMGLFLQLTGNTHWTLLTFP